MSNEVELRVPCKVFRSQAPFVAEEAEVPRFHTKPVKVFEQARLVVGTDGAYVDHSSVVENFVGGIRANANHLR